MLWSFVIGHDKNRYGNGESFLFEAKAYFLYFEKKET